MTIHQVNALPSAAFAAATPGTHEYFPSLPRPAVGGYGLDASGLLRNQPKWWPKNKPRIQGIPS